MATKLKHQNGFSEGFRQTRNWNETRRTFIPIQPWNSPVIRHEPSSNLVSGRDALPEFSENQRDQWCEDKPQVTQFSGMTSPRLPPDSGRGGEAISKADLMTVELARMQSLDRQDVRQIGQLVFDRDS